jgi:hypothetical protein
MKVNFKKICRKVMFFFGIKTFCINFAPFLEQNETEITV